MSMEMHMCSVCRLHYRSKKLSDECYRWCATHDSCNMEIGRQSIEAKAISRRH